ncbi:Pxp2p ASCRUDRAFT_37566 [Ascoidea rubescens DSM 1968]|uniref:Carboxymuconolactone decarboxylase-like domain-containing protein n=1 Tax=Ascoidea rubescens DSM 1968 TaxID=1344418 RepID=A0A1D2VDA9_9ASCO|nr:hypothetical protein ASCRUDRAFT_37566 [Ascoidea rubescens DSM 1968]ODV59473.1 hypothetical protein ASCRUDRAFT_37566 [Ascoidea rubescens DSM 1968]
MSILTPARLLQLSSAPQLQSSWYFIAAATLTICNEPGEIPSVFHLALKQSQKIPLNLSVAEDSINFSKHLIYKNSIGEIEKKIENLNSDLVDEESNFKNQFEVAQKTREALLKCSALGGIPKSINSLMILKNSTPLQLLERNENRDNSISNITNERERGRQYWDQVYGKVSSRVIGQMNNAYPDLWSYARDHVYSPLLSFSDILDPRETSLVVVACLIPLDVNPQLKGHLKGALNNGCSKEEISSARALSIQIAEWCGYKWKGNIVSL